MQWTDRIRQVKILLIVAAVLISIASLVVSHFLVADLQVEEKNKMEVWAQAMQSLNDADEFTDLALVLKVINSNNTIPVIVEGAGGDVQTFRNVRLSASNARDSVSELAANSQRMQNEGKVITISLDGGESVKVCYDDSLLLRRLAWWPYIQLGIVFIFVIVAIFAMLTSQRAEQNKVWVGLSKETAHQLGTPISSLMAWVEILRESYPDDAVIPELDNDVKRLQLVAERFSKIGSMPEAKPCDIRDVLNHVVTYISRRTSNRVEVLCDLPQQEVRALVSDSLFEWVVENLCKNAIDAMEGKGRIEIMLKKEAYCVAIEVSDTGKGIPGKYQNTIFTPGFTTKARGWGLGLSLARRIVEEYHHGSIFVKSSELGKGTTFRIELPVFDA